MLSATADSWPVGRRQPQFAVTSPMPANCRSPPTQLAPSTSHFNHVAGREQRTSLSRWSCVASVFSATDRHRALSSAAISVERYGASLIECMKLKFQSNTSCKKDDMNVKCRSATHHLCVSNTRRRQRGHLVTMNMRSARLFSTEISVEVRQ